MKKFYTLLAAAVLTMGVADAAVKMVDTKAGEPVARIKTSESFTKVSGLESVSSDAVLKSTPKKVKTASELAGTYYVSGIMSSGTQFYDPFTIAKGASENEVLLKNFIFGSQASDIKATITTYTEDGTTYDALEFANGQDWFVREGKQCKMYPGYWVANQGFDLDNESETFTFVIVEDMMIPLFGWMDPSTNERIPGGLVWAFEDAGSYRGNAFNNIMFLPPNGTLTAEVTFDGSNFESMSAPVFAYTTSRRGRTYLTINGMAARSNVFEPMELTCDVNNGTQSAVDQLAGSFYTDESYTTTFDVYYFNGDATTSMTVNSSTSLDNGVTVLSFGDVLYLWVKEDGDKGGMLAWAEPVIKFNVDFGLGGPAAIEGVSADVDANAPVEFFNIQGQRIDNPANGQLVIRRQGSKVEKLIVR